MDYSFVLECVINFKYSSSTFFDPKMIKQTSPIYPKYGKMEGSKFYVNREACERNPEIQAGPDWVCLARVGSKNSVNQVGLEV